MKDEVIKVAACMEATGSYGKSFADFLYSNGHEISVVNPSCIKAFAKSKALQDLYRCSQNLKEQYVQTQNYLENKEHLSKAVCSSYNKLAKYIMKEIKNIELKIDNLLTDKVYSEAIYLLKVSPLR